MPTGRGSSRYRQSSPASDITRPTHESTHRPTGPAGRDTRTVRAASELVTRSTTAHRFWTGSNSHQQYLVKNPFGYCPDNGTGVTCPVGLFGRDAS
jgi:peptide-methionine (S)-S-oxide reductase